MIRRRTVVGRKGGQVGSSGGDAALGWAAPSGLADGNTLTITTDGTYNFGTIGPTAVMYDEFAGTAGQAHGASAIVGTWTANAALMVDDATMPNGRGIRMLTTDNVNDKFVWPAQASEFFLSGWLKFSGSIPWSNGKIFWALMGSGANSDSTKPDHWFPDMHSGVYDIMGTNDAGAFSDVNNWGATTAAPLRIMCWAKPNGTTASGSDGAWQTLQSGTGITASRDWADYKAWFTASHSPQAWDRIHVVGFATGASYPTNDLLLGQIYCATGAGSAARVEIGDDPVYANCTNLSICTIDSWDSSAIAATIRTGVFYASGVASLYFHVFNAQNNLIATGQFS